MAQGLTRDGGWTGKEMFQLDPQNKDGCRPQAREDRLRETGTGAHRAGLAVHQVFTLEPSVYGQTGRMRPAQQGPRSITSTPQESSGKHPLHA